MLRTPILSDPKLQGCGCPHMGSLRPIGHWGAQDIYIEVMGCYEVSGPL